MTGEFLKRKIKASGIQQVEVAKKLNITPQSLESKLKSRDIKVSFLVKVAKAIGRNINYFLEEEEPELFYTNYNKLYTFKKNSEIKIANSEEEVVTLEQSSSFDFMAEEVQRGFINTDKNIDLLADAMSRALLNQDEIIHKLELILTTDKESS